MENVTEVPVVVRLERLVECVTELAGTRRIGTRFQSEVRKHIETLKNGVDALRALHEIFDLSDLELELGGRKANLDYWKKLPPGHYCAGNSKAINEPSTVDQSEHAAALETLYKTKSQTLNALYKAGLEFISIRKFDESELSFALAMGDKFQRIRRTWSRFKGALVNKKAPLECPPHAYHAARDFFVLLERHKIIDSYSLSLQRAVDEEGKQEKTRVVIEQIELDQLIQQRKIVATDKIFFEYADKLDTKKIPLVTGIWFEAFAYKVFEDTLTRLANEYELYSDVAFSAQIALKGRTRSDFDILVGLPDQIIMTECKSGKITPEVVQEIVGKATFLKRIFASMGVEKYLFLLVFSPTDDPEQFQSLEEIKSSGYVVVEPYNIAPFLNAYIQNIPPEDGLVWAPPAEHA